MGAGGGGRVEVKLKLVINIIISVLAIITLAVGCIEYYEKEQTPTDIVKQFASSYAKENFDTCYDLMSVDYKNRHDFNTFVRDMNQCSSGWDKYEFIGVVDGSEVIGNNTAILEITYKTHKTDDYFLGLLIDSFDELLRKDKTFNKQIKLIKEDSGWKLDDLHCELKKR